MVIILRRKWQKGIPKAMPLFFVKTKSKNKKSLLKLGFFIKNFFISISVANRKIIAMYDKYSEYLKNFTVKRWSIKYLV